MTKGLTKRKFRQHKILFTSKKNLSCPFSTPGFSVATIFSGKAITQETSESREK